MDRNRIEVEVEGREAVFGPGVPEITVGRDRGCLVRLGGPGVADRHLVLRHGDSGWTVETLDAANGVFHEGRPVDRLSVDRVLRLRLGDPEDGAELVVSPAEEDDHLLTIDFAAEQHRGTDREVDAPRSIALEADVVRIGRDADSDVIVDDLLVSRRHAELRRRADEAIEVVDLSSHNGTFVNGRRISRTVLAERDVVTIGRHSYQLVDGRLEEEVDTGEVAFAAADLVVRVPRAGVLLDRVTFSLEPSTLLGIIGPSGCGKSILVKALNGFAMATAGDVFYDHRSLYTGYDALRRRIGYVPQNDILHEGLTVREELEYAADLRFPPDVDPDLRARRIEEVMAELNIADRAGLQIARLSGGQRKRVSLALELLTKPSLLFLDEATSGLDPNYERSLMNLFRRLADGGRTVVVVTHSVQSLRLCDRVLILAPGGRMAYFGPPQLATAYFELPDLPDVFRALSEEEDVDWGERFRAHPYHGDFVERERTVPEEGRKTAPEADVSISLASRGWWKQFTTLIRRYTAVLASDRRNLALLLLQAPLLGLLMLAALPAGELEAAPPSELRVFSQAGLVLLVIVLGVTWLGLSNAVREIAKELPIFRRERAAGLSISAYLGSKVVVLGLITAVQAAVLAAIAISRQGGPDGAAALGWPLGEIMLAAALAGVAAVALGLLISAAAGSSDRATTVLPIVLVFLLVLALGGVFPQIGDKPVLKQLGYVASTKWGFSGVASTAELNDLQSVAAVLTRTPSVQVEDPEPLFRAFSEGERGDPSWDHEVGTWLADAGALVGLTLVALLAAGLALLRRDPGRRAG